MEETHICHEQIQQNHDIGVTYIPLIGPHRKISNREPLIITSDGFVYTSSSGGAWPIATIDGYIIITSSNKDTAHEPFEKSYRSEAQVGYISYLFLQVCTIFNGLEVAKVLYNCNNKGLVIKIN